MNLMIDLKERNQLKRFVSLLKHMVNSTSLEEIVETLMENYYIISTHYIFVVEEESFDVTNVIFEIMSDLMPLATKNQKKLYTFIDLILNNFRSTNYEEYKQLTEKIDLSSPPELVMIALDEQMKEQILIDQKLLTSMDAPLN